MVMIQDPLISVESLHIVYHEHIRENLFSFGKVKQHVALKGASFKVFPEDKIAIIGRNGSGKSTLLKAMAGMIRPHDGLVESKGRVLYLSGVNPGFMPEMTGRMNIIELGSAYGVEKEEMDAFVEGITAFAELGENIDRKVTNYSSGMKSKLGFGFTTALKCDLLLIDESLNAGDREFKRKANLRMNSFIESAGTMVLCTHSISEAKKCNRCIVMDDGNIVFDGEILEGLEFYDELTKENSVWIEIPYTIAYFDPNGYSFNLNSEFQVEGDFRLIIWDREKKEFVSSIKFDAEDDVIVPTEEIPTDGQGKYKLQQLVADNWIDCSRYVVLKEKAE
jgi:ABC-type polysaccharide/polyol phosphate transport system ATPase subunit